jgi:ankyrin repeat protein
VLQSLVKKALNCGHARVFSATFKHALALEKKVRGAYDAVSLFVLIAGGTHDKISADGARVRVLDRALVARCLRLVFTRFRGDANDATNQMHGGARTPLIYAIQDNRPELVRVLLAHGADAGCASYDNEYPLIWACKAASAELVHTLVPHSRVALAHLTCGEFTRVALRHGLHSLPLSSAERERAYAMICHEGVLA